MKGIPSQKNLLNNYKNQIKHQVKIKKIDSKNNDKTFKKMIYTSRIQDLEKELLQMKESSTTLNWNTGHMPSLSETNEKI